MKTFSKFVRSFGWSKLPLLIGASLFIAQAATAAPILYTDQSSAISAAADTVRMARVPVANNAGVISYWDVTLKLTADGTTGRPAIAPANILVSPSPGLISAAFRAGKYKDIFGNGYTVTGPGAAAGGRSNWSVLLSKPAAGWTGYFFGGNWTTGAIAGHPIENKIRAQSINLSAYSWGTVNNLNSGSFNLYGCSVNSRVVGYVQVGDKLVLHGYCNGNNVESAQFVLSQCTTANPCP
jgi:hypothetical protein